MIEALENEIYLVLSHYSFERFDKSKKLVCISDRCLDAEWINELENYPNIKICDVHETHLNSKKIFDRIIRMRNDMIDILTPIFNEYHGVNHTAEYWIAYSWFAVNHLICSWIELYDSIEYVLKKYSKITLVAYIDHKYDVAEHGDQEDYMNSYIRQLLGLQIFMELAPNNRCIIQSCKEFDVYSCKSIKNNSCDSFNKVLWKLYRKLSKNAPVDIMYNQIKNAKQLRLKFLGKVYWSSQEEPSYSKKKIDKISREKYLKYIDYDFTKEQCGQLFIKHLYENLPAMMWEDYASICSASKTNYFYSPKVILYHGYLTVRMEFIARMKERGTKIVLAAHSFEEDFRILPISDEKAYDKKYIWINQRFCNEKKSLSGRSYFYDNAEKVDYKKNSSIIFFSYGMNRSNGHAIIFDERESMIAKEMSSRNIRFFRELHIHLRKKAVFRHRDDTNWGYVAALEKKYPEIEIDDSFINNRYLSFENRIKNSRISVVETIHSSTFFHSIMYNVPTIIIDNCEYRGFFSDAVCDLLEPLKRVRVWVETPEEAANIVNEYYDDIDEWWNEPERKKIVDNICNELFVNKDMEIMEYWKREYKLLKGLIID